jgi:hypothetical protein
MPRKLLHKGVCWKGNGPCRDDRCRPCLAYLTGAAMIEGEYALFPGAVAAQPTSSLREPSPGIRASLLMQAKFFRRERSCRSPRGDTQPLRLSAILVSTFYPPGIATPRLEGDAYTEFIDVASIATGSALLQSSLSARHSFFGKQNLPTAKPSAAFSPVLGKVHRSCLRSEFVRGGSG